MSVKKYKVYKDSGEYWLGEIPENWKVLTLKKLGKLSTSSVDKKIVEGEKMVSLLNYLDVYKSKNKKIESNEGLMQVSASEQNIKSSDLLKGDVVFTPSSETIEDIGHSILVSKDLDNTLYSYHVLRLRFNKNFEILDDFKKYMFNNFFFLNQLSSKARGTTRMTLGLKDFYSSCICLPHINEQHQIAAFLDYKTALIDEIIAKKERLIELLQAKRQATINEVVTGKKVWNAASQTWEAPAKVKDSGVEWLGEIPKEWEVVKLKYLVELNNNRRLDNEDYSSFKVALENIQSFTGKFVSSENENEFEGQGNFFNVGDILFNKLRPYLSKVYHVEKAGQSVGELLVFTPNARITSRFLFYRLMSSNFVNLVNSSTYGAKMPRASWDFIGNIKLAIPDIEIQQRNSIYLDTQIQKIEDLSAKLHTQIQSLKSYRQSLISEAVTGKIDVREWEVPKENILFDN